MIPRFPQFQPLDEVDRDDYRRFVAPYPPYSDLSYVSLWTWNLGGTTAVSSLDGNLVVRLEDYATGEPFLTLLGERDVPAAVEELLDWMPSAGLAPRLRRVPEETVAALGAGGALLVREDRDNADYILPVADLATLAGGRFERRRRGIRRLQKETPGYEVRTLSLASAAVRDEIESVVARWWEEKSSVAGTAERDLGALRRCLALESIGGLVTTGVYMAGELAGFAVNEPTDGGWVVEHYVRSLRGIRGLPELLQHETAKVMLGLGCRWRNIQEDLGIEGLREWKLSLQPERLLRKFEIRRSA